MRIILIVAALLAFLAPPAGAQEARVALVIGNGKYVNAEALKNPVNDARGIAKVLRAAGFDVIVRENANRRGMTEALREFSGKLAPGGVGLFYYAGHGMQVRGANYLLPIDAALSTEDELKYETVDVNDVLGRLDEARSRLSLVILDACRDNPFARRFRSTTRGLAQTDAPRGTVIAYATAPGDTAADGDGDNGLYTAELLKSIAMPGLKLEEVFKHTMDGVARASNNRQTPWVSSSFRGEFIFTAGPAAPMAPPAPIAAPPPPVSAPAPTSPAFDTVEQTAWTTIASSTDPAMFELFLRRFPNGVYADFARLRLEGLRRQAAEEAKRQPAVEDGRRQADIERQRPPPDELRPLVVEQVEPVLQITDIDRERIQAALTARGFDTQGNDGIFGPRTRQMITNWQRSRFEPPTGMLTTSQAVALIREGRQVLAEAMVRDAGAAIRQSPSAVVNYLDRGNAYEELGDYERAIQDYNQAIRLDPKNADARNARCWAGAILGRLDQALDDCNESLRLQPGNYQALDSRGLVHLKAGRYDAAIADYTAALRIEPGQQQSLYGRGIARQRKGDTAGAAADIAAAKAIQSDIVEEFVGYGVR